MNAVLVQVSIGIHMRASPQQAREGNAFEMHAVLIQMSIGVHMQASPQQAREGNALKWMQF